MEGKDFVKAKFFNKKHVLLDDIELTIPCNEGSYIYFGKRIIMFDYYRQRNLPFPIGQYDEKLEREITFDDLIGRSYIEFDDGSIETNVEPGSITFDEIQRMICGEEKKLEYRRSL